MLADFVLANREEIVTRCRTKVTGRSSPPQSETEINHGVPMFLEELLDSLHLDVSAHADIAATATKHGRDRLRQGFTPAQVVHDYGDICQTITEMVIETHTPIAADDFRLLNKCLDEAIAAAITEYQRERDASTTEQSSREDNRMRGVIDQMRVSVLAADIAFEAIQSGYTGLRGSTGMILTRRLKALKEMSERIQLALPTSR
jgi:RsbRD-like negative regulator of sigma factor